MLEAISIRTLIDEITALPAFSQAIGSKEYLWEEYSRFCLNKRVVLLVGEHQESRMRFLKELLPAQTVFPVMGDRLISLWQYGPRYRLDLSNPEIAQVYLPCTSLRDIILVAFAPTLAQEPDFLDRISGYLLQADCINFLTYSRNALSETDMGFLKAVDLSGTSVNLIVHHAECLDPEDIAPLYDWLNERMPGANVHMLKTWEQVQVQGLDSKILAQTPTFLVRTVFKASLWLSAREKALQDEETALLQKGVENHLQLNQLLERQKLILAQLFRFRDSLSEDLQKHCADLRIQLQEALLKISNAYLPDESSSCLVRQEWIDLLIMHYENILEKTLDIRRTQWAALVGMLLPERDWNEKVSDLCMQAKTVHKDALQDLISGMRFTVARPLGTLEILDVWQDALSLLLVKIQEGEVAVIRDFYGQAAEMVKQRYCTLQAESDNRESQKLQMEREQTAVSQRLNNVRRAQQAWQLMREKLLAQFTQYSHHRMHDSSSQKFCTLSTESGT